MLKTFESKCLKLQQSTLYGYGSDQRQQAVGAKGNDHNVRPI